MKPLVRLVLVCECSCHCLNGRHITVIHLFSNSFTLECSADASSFCLFLCHGKVKLELDFPVELEGICHAKVLGFLSNSLLLYYSLLRDYRLTSSHTCGMGTLPVLQVM
jgi:hypothetical protein